jgi:hypothetical protein
MNDYNNAIESTIKTLSAYIEALNDAEYVLSKIKKSKPGIYDHLIDVCIKTIRAALNRPYIYLSIFLSEEKNDA